ncbi:retrovirus-related pol polyprotein from transposon TNT 1-94 [Tanacetum coccineum]
MKAREKASFDRGLINMGGPHTAAPKEIIGPPPVITPGSEKSMSFQKSILGPRPKHIIVNNVKVPVASDNEICLGVDLEPDEWIKDSICSKHMTGNRKLFSTYKEYNGGNVIFGSNLRGNNIGKGKICDNKCRVTFFEHDSEITKNGKVIGCTIVSIRTNQGREFDNEVQFGEFCNANGMTRNFSAPLTPQSNGMVERKNRTLQGMRKTPYELLRGRKPTLDYFRVCGSKCFILNTKDYITKFDPKSYEGIFHGYSQNSKSYIILNKHTSKIEESLNVTFDETPPPSKTSPLVDDDLDEEEAIRATKKKNLENVVEDETP